MAATYPLVEQCDSRHDAKERAEHRKLKYTVMVEGVHGIYVVVTFMGKGM